MKQDAVKAVLSYVPSVCSKFRIALKLGTNLSLYPFQKPLKVFKDIRWQGYGHIICIVDAVRYPTNDRLPDLSLAPSTGINVGISIIIVYTQI